MIIRKRSQFPKCIRHFKEVKGISVGKCIYDEPILPAHSAHAHCYYKGSRGQGWICLSYKYQLKERLTLLHEVAHLIANTNKFVASHGNKWKKTVVSIGGTYRSYPSYNRKYMYEDFF